MAAPEVIAGGLTEVPGQIDFSPEDGEILSEAHEGSRDAVLDFFAQERTTPTKNWSRIIVQHFGTHSRIDLIPAAEGDLEVIDGVIRELWELDRNLVQMALRSNSVFDQIGQGPYLDFFDRKLAAREDPDFATPEQDLAGVEKETVDYYFLRLNGTKSYQFTAYLLRYTRLVASDSDVQSAHEDENRVVPLPDNVPTILLGNIPETHEFMKQTPEVNNAGRNRFNLVQEYWGGTPLWSSLLYGGTYDPTPPEILAGLGL